MAATPKPMRKEIKSRVGQVRNMFKEEKEPLKSKDKKKVHKDIKGIIKKEMKKR